MPAQGHIFYLKKLIKMKQYYLFDAKKKYLSTNFYKEKPVNSTEIAPMVATEYAQWNETVWVDTRGENYILVPQSVTAIQFLSQLELQGITEANILDIINNLPSPDNIVAKNSYFRATSFERSNPLLTLVGISYGITEAELDELFINASKL
jgi:hypothetical protein